jgi:hypothetical protein
MYFAGIGRDHVAGAGVDDAAPAQRAMGASLHEAEAERRVPVPVVLAGAVGIRTEDARPWRTDDAAGMHAVLHGD